MNFVLNLKRSDTFKLVLNKRYEKGNKIFKPFPDPITVEEYLRHWICLQGVLKKSTIKSLISYVKDYNLKRTLESYILPKNRNIFNSFIRKKLGLIDFLVDHKIQLKLEELIDISSNIQPRYYTIASSSKINQNRVAMCISLTIDEMSDGAARPGLASNQMLEIFNDFKCGKERHMLVNFQESNFVIPDKVDTPC